MASRDRIYPVRGRARALIPGDLTSKRTGSITFCQTFRDFRRGFCRTASFAPVRMSCRPPLIRTPSFNFRGGRTRYEGGLLLPIVAGRGPNCAFAEFIDVNGATPPTCKGGASMIVGSVEQMSLPPKEGGGFSPPLCRCFEAARARSSDQRLF